MLTWYTGDREALRPLFALADDSPANIDQVIHLGHVLVANTPNGPIAHLQLVPRAPGTIELTSMAVLDAHAGQGIGRQLVQAALAWCKAEGFTTVVVATAAADVGVLRFYQRQGFRMDRIERDAFTPETGYPVPIDVDGVPLRDRVWLSLVL